MSILFLILFVMAGLHFIYEGIILPSIRLELRHKLYALRDKLRRLKIEDQNLPDEVFMNLQDSINGLLNILPLINITFFRRLVREIYSNRDLQKRMDQRVQLYQSINSTEVNGILSALDKTWMYALVLNCMVAILYLLPLFLLYELITCLKKLLLRQNVTNLQKIIHKAALTPATELNSYALKDSTAAYAFR
jgi:hypothetical protein